MEGFLAIDSCSRTIVYCFLYCFLEIIAGEQGCDGRGQSRDKGRSPQYPPPTRENPVHN